MSAPPTPTITGTFDDANSVVHLTVTSNGAAYVIVTHTISGGSPIKVRYSDETTPGAGGVFLIDDHETPQKGTVTYTARGYDSAGNASGVSAALVINLAGTSFWLKDPITPSLSMKLRLDQVSIMYKKTRQQAVFTPLRGNRKYTLNGPQLGYEFTLNLLLYTNAEFFALESLLNNGNTLLLKLDDGRAFYVRQTSEISYEDMVTTQRLTAPLRRVTLGLIETVIP